VSTIGNKQEGRFAWPAELYSAAYRLRGM